MQIAAEELQVIISALRVAAVAYGEKAKMTRLQGRLGEAREIEAYVQACAALSDRLALAGGRIGGGIILPRH